MRKKAQFEQAVQFRKRGFTYVEIAKIVGVSKSTVSLWFSRETWSSSISQSNKKRASKENSKRISLLNKARSNQNKKLYVEAKRSAMTEYKHYMHNPLFVAGIMLYMGAGDIQDPHKIRISSHDSNVHRIFHTFAEEFLGVSRENIRFWVLLYPYMSPNKCLQKWSKSLKLPLTQFHKHQISKISSNTSVLHDGVGNTIIGSTVLKHKLLTWIECVQKEL